MGMAPEPKSEAWAALIGPLGIAGAAVGQRVKAAAAAPPLAGLVEWAGPPEYPEELFLRLDDPAPGLAHIFAMPMGGQICMAIRVYLYGDRASAAVARDEPLWQSWMNERFPAASDASSVA
jgi:predicted secreted protein